jgi:hypothetical protein
MGKQGNKMRKARNKLPSAKEVKEILTEQRTYPSEGPLAEGDLLSAEEALAQEEQLLGRRGVPKEDVILGLPGPIRQDAYFKPKAPVNWAGKEDAPLDCLGRKKAPEPEPSPLLLPLLTEPAIVQPRRVTIIADHTLTYPDLYLQVYIAGDPMVA